ncbi:MAG: Rieske (2Fe-2S) protein [Thermoleophilaceae bacterium]
MNATSAISRARVPVLDAAELPPGARATVEAFGGRIALFNVDGAIRAVNNACPHAGGPICHGHIGGRLLRSAPLEYVWSDEPVVTCPWHGWQFDLATGGALFDPEVTVPVYDVVVEDARIYLLEPAD